MAEWYHSGGRSGILAEKATLFGGVVDESKRDPVDAYRKDVDVTLLRENLRLTPTQRLEKLQEHLRFAEELRQAGRRARGEKP